MKQRRAASRSNVRGGLAFAAGLAAVLGLTGGTDALLLGAKGAVIGSPAASDAGWADALVRLFMLTYTAIYCMFAGLLTRRLSGGAAPVIALAGTLFALSTAYALAVPEDGPLWYRASAPVAAAAACSIALHRRIGMVPMAKTLLGSRAQ